MGKETKISSWPRGQTMLELIVALAMLLIVVTAVMAMTVSSIAGSKVSENEIIANNLAREAIEVIRNRRDSNWLAQQPWDGGLADPAGLTNAAITDFDVANNDWEIIFTEAESDYRLYRHADSVISHGPPEAGDIDIGFSRHVVLDNICLDKDTKVENIDGKDCHTNSVKIGISIRAIVAWLDRTGEKQVTLEDLIYDWK